MKRSCKTGKRRFHDEDEAKAALTRIRQRSVEEEVPQRVYGPCPFCSGWHLTKRPELPPLVRRRAGKPLERRTRLRPVSDAREAQDPVYEVAKVTAVLRDRGCCQAEGMPGVPHGGPKDPHHVLPLGRGGPRCEPLNLLVLCRASHDWAHTHPIEAEEMGLLLKAGAALDDMEEAARVRELWRSGDRYPAA